MKPVVILTITILAVGAGIYLIFSDVNHNLEKLVVENTEQKQDTEKMPEANGGENPENSSYTIEGQTITLVDGQNVKTIPNSSSKIVTNIWGTPTPGDLNSDQLIDAAVILNQEPGGSGSFYYVAASMNQEGLFYGTNAIFLGDRIAMQNYSIEEGIIVVNYAERPEEATMSDQPSIGVTQKFKVNGLTLTEVK